MSTALGKGTKVPGCPSDPAPRAQDLARHLSAMLPRAVTVRVEFHVGPLTNWPHMEVSAANEAGAPVRVTRMQAQIAARAVIRTHPDAGWQCPRICAPPAWTGMWPAGARIHAVKNGLRPHHSGRRQPVERSGQSRQRFPGGLSRHSRPADQAPHSSLSATSTEIKNQLWILTRVPAYVRRPPGSPARPCEYEEQAPNGPDLEGPKTAAAPERCELPDAVRLQA